MIKGQELKLGAEISPIILQMFIIERCIFKGKVHIAEGKARKVSSVVAFNSLSLVFNIWALFLDPSGQSWSTSSSTCCVS